MAEWVFAGIILVLLILSVSGWYFSNRILHPNTHSHTFARQHEIEQGKINPGEFAALPREEVHIPSPYGYDLNGLFFPQPGAVNSIIICHGITWNLYGSIKYMGMFYRRGYNVLLYDHRNHGNNLKTNTTYGFYEKHDLVACIDWLEAKNGPEVRIGLMGESLGAGVALQAAAIDPRVNFVVADCPYSDLLSLLEYREIQEYHLPPKLPLFLAGILIHWLAGFHLDQVSPIRDLKDVDIPILFAHGVNDTYIPPVMSEEMYRQRPMSRRLFLAQNAGHAQAYWNNREEYEELVDQFLTEMVECEVSQ